MIRWESLSYEWFELPKVKAEIEKLPGVMIERVLNSNPGDESPWFVWTLQIGEKGLLAIVNPRAEDIANNNPVIIVRIGDCVHFPSPHETASLGEVVDRYEEIYEKARAYYDCASP